MKKDPSKRYLNPKKPGGSHSVSYCHSLYNNSKKIKYIAFRIVFETVQVLTKVLMGHYNHSISVDAKSWYQRAVQSFVNMPIALNFVAQ